jgi:hypothetical protein
MKTTITILLSVIIFFTANSQVPKLINYQAVARTSQGLIIPNQNIGIRLSVIDNTINGAILYQETQNATTNNYGLFTLAIGNGTAVAGTFAAINWASGTSKFLKVEIAPQGGINYLVQGTSQLLSVPYALYAEKTNLVGGAGINITGNVISATGSGISQWINDANGIYYQNALGGIGVGGNSESNAALAVTQKATGGFSAAASFKSADTWHTVIRFDNTTTSPSGSYALTLAGSTNTAMPPKSFALYNGIANKFVWITDGTTNGYLGIGSYSGIASVPKSRLHVFAGDVNIDQIGSGIIMKSPDGNCWRITIDNSGNLVRTAITCL